MESPVDLILKLLVLLIAVGWIYLAYWTVRDAGRIGRNRLLWGILVFANPLIFGLIYFLHVREAPREISLTDLSNPDAEEPRTDSDIDRLIATLTRTGWAYGITTYKDEYGQEWTQIDATRGAETKTWKWKTEEHDRGQNEQ
jgi:hypothetical protein